MKKTEYSHLEETIGRRDELKAERQRLHDALQTFPSVGPWQEEARGLRHERQRSLDALADRGVKDPDKSSSIRELDEQIAAKERQIEETEAERERLHARICEIDAELLGMRAGSLQAVLDHQAALDAAEQEVTKLQTLHDEHRARIAAATGYEDPLPALEQRREDLLAAIATGEAKEEALKTLDAEIEQASAKVADKVARAEATMERSGATLRGLRSRLDRAQAERDRLAAMAPKVLSFALRSEIEEAGKDYRRHAEQVLADFKRLMGLATVLSSIDRGEAGRTGYGQGNSLRLPKFNLDVFADLTGETGRRYFFDAEHNHAYRTEGEQAQRQHLTEQGVRLP